MAELFHDREYESRRRHISRLINSHKEDDITLDNVPESLAVLPDGSKFLQLQTPTFQMYYSKATIKKAVDNGLKALVADGIHKVLPKKLGDNAQLYTIRGVCNGTVEVLPTFC
ncbi:hypothetical protein ANCCAN_15512 [Ancylostoma caninum]|uniref:Uncharacterized protein n=1 Tax=Ancylostoma caninum TaxID=29170 RepID=A0A368G2I0_ANCCA|nr:hypothetical protein ANCCAN_15512 [Ancylostoma caninum]